MFDANDIKILNCLLSSEVPLTSQKIGNFVNISSRTVRNRLKEMEQDINGKGGKLLFKRGAGISIVFEKQTDFIDYKEWLNTQEVYSVKVNELDALILLLIKENEYYKSSEIAEKLFVSTSKLSLLIKEVKPILKNYQLMLKNKPYSGIKLVGSEADYRRFLASNYVQSAIFSQIEREEQGLWFSEVPAIKNEIKEIIFKEMTNVEYQVPTNRLESLAGHLSIAIKRIKSGDMIDQVDFQFEMMQEYFKEATKEQLLAEKIMEVLQKKYEIIFTEYEYYHLLIQLQSKKVMEISEKNTISSDVNQLVEKILLEIKTSKNINLLNDFDLRTMLALHLTPLITRIRFGIELNNPILEDVKKECLAGYDLATIASMIIGEEYQTKLSDHEISYLALHFDVSLNRKNTSEKTRKNILIVCSTGRASSQLLKIKFEKLFNQYLQQVDVCDVRQWQSLSEKNCYEYIFSTVPLQGESRIPIFYFDFFLNNERIQEIENVLNGKEKINWKRHLRPKLVLLNKDFLSKEECLEHLLKNIQEKMQVPDNFSDLVYEREAFFGTDILPNVALPHPNKLVSEKTFISMMTLKKSVLWGKNKVKVIVLVSIARKDSEHYKQVLDELIDKLSNQEVMDQLFNTKKYDDVIRVLEGGNS